MAFTRVRTRRLRADRCACGMLEWRPARAVRQLDAGCQCGQFHDAHRDHSDTDAADTDHNVAYVDVDGRGLYGSAATLQLRLHALPWNAIAGGPLLHSELRRYHGGSESGQRVECAGHRHPARWSDVWLLERRPRGQSRTDPDLGTERRAAKPVSQNVTHHV